MRAKKATPPVTEKVLVLRTCDPERKSRNGSFQYPASGLVEAPDWKANAECGNGLHGWLWGAGNWSLKRKEHDSLWLVIEVVAADVIDLQGKVKFPRGEVLGVFGRWNEAMEFIRLRRPPVEAESTATGNFGHAAATGYFGHAAATGHFGHAAATGDSGHAAATGNSGHAAATGNFGHAAATGNAGHAAATGDFGHAAATGNFGHAAAGRAGRAKAGPNGSVSILWWDGKRNRVAVGYVGEDGIEANQWYRVKDGKLVTA